MSKKQELMDRVKKKKNPAMAFIDGMEQDLPKKEEQSDFSVDNEGNVNVSQEENVQVKRNSEDMENIDVITEFEKVFGHKKGIEQTHKRQTFLIEKELIKRLDSLSKKKRKGFKTFAVNYAIEQMLDQLEEE